MLVISFVRFANLRALTSCVQMYVNTNESERKIKTLEVNIPDQHIIYSIAYKIPGLNVELERDLQLYFPLSQSFKFTTLLDHSFNIHYNNVLILLGRPRYIFPICPRYKMLNVLLRAENSLEDFASKTFSPFSSLKMRDEVSRPCSTTSKNEKTRKKFLMKRLDVIISHASQKYLIAYRFQID